MNIREAKQQIKNAMVAYFTKDEFGNYRLPAARQPPVAGARPPRPIDMGARVLWFTLCTNGAKNFDSKRSDAKEPP